MFTHSIDEKNIVTTPEGDRIVDLTTSVFKNTTPVSDYVIRKVPATYVMRPDLISTVEFGSPEYTEYVMMFNECGNPFSLDKDDILLIPDKAEADDMIKSSIDENKNDASVRDVLIKNSYRFTDPSAAIDYSSYDTYEKSSIPSYNNPNNMANASSSMDTSIISGNQKAPYLLDENEMAVSVKNGRIFFNNENNSTDNKLKSDMITSENIDSKIQELMSGLDTSLSSTNCIYNGVSLCQMIKASNNSKLDSSKNG